MEINRMSIKDQIKYASTIHDMKVLDLKGSVVFVKPIAKQRSQLLKDVLNYPCRVVGAYRIEKV